MSPVSRLLTCAQGVGASLLGSLDSLILHSATCSLRTHILLVRAWSQHFLRVSFTEENGKRLCYASDNGRLADFYSRQARTRAQL